MFDSILKSLFFFMFFLKFLERGDFLQIFRTVPISRMKHFKSRNFSRLFFFSFLGNHYFFQYFIFLKRFMCFTQ